MIDATLLPGPAGFIAALGIRPPENEPVLAIRVSGYTCCTFELLTARYMPTYRPRSPWRDISNDAVADSGGDIIGWRPATAWIGPTCTVPTPHIRAGQIGRASGRERGCQYV